jgi:hypothetical protein
MPKKAFGADMKREIPEVVRCWRARESNEYAQKKGQGQTQDSMAREESQKDG